MKMLKRWLAFFVVVVLLIGVAFNGRSPIAASQIDKVNTTEGAAAEPAMEQQGSEASEAADNSNAGSNGDTNGKRKPASGIDRKHREWNGSTSGCNGTEAGSER